MLRWLQRWEIIDIFTSFFCFFFFSCAGCRTKRTRWPNGRTFILNCFFLIHWIKLTFLLLRFLPPSNKLFIKELLLSVRAIHLPAGHNHRKWKPDLTQQLHFRLQLCFLNLLTPPSHQGPPGEQGPRGPRGDKGEKVSFWKVKSVLFGSDFGELKLWFEIGSLLFLLHWFLYQIGWSVVPSCVIL